LGIRRLRLRKHSCRREGAAPWILRVSKNGNKNEIKKRTFFTTSFDKNREDDGVPKRNMDWSFVTENGKTQKRNHRAKWGEIRRASAEKEKMPKFTQRKP
jgi:hypothetical protein